MAEQNLQKGIELYSQGKFEEAAPYIYSYVQLQGGWVIANDMTFMTENQRSEYWENHKKPYTEFIPMLAYKTHADSIIAETYNSALLSKGILLNASTTMRQFIQNSNDHSLELLLNKYNDLKEQYVKCFEDFNTVKSGMVLKIGVSIDSIGSILKSKIPMDRFAILLNLRWTDIQESMDTEDAAIEFIDFPMQDGRTMYAALVLRKDYKRPVMETLFTSEQLILSKEYPYVNEGAAYQMIWKKLVPYLTGISNIYFSPTGILHKLALEYLPDEQSLPINWLYSMHRLSSTRELLTARVSPKSNIKSVLYGGLNYTTCIKGENDAQTNREQDEVLKRNVGNLRKVINQEMEYLPGTYSEILSINNGFKEHGLTCEMLWGDEGTEESLRNLSKKQIDILHIATHGFYFSTTDSAKEMFCEEQMMLQSGLFMSGANQTLEKGGALFQAVDNDGIVTAQEISQLDLSHTDLVTLSACETALGEIGGDGVFGLQRGFKKAGVQSELVSLWPVNDEATSVFMTSFYKYYLTLNKKYRALQLAQQALCRSYGGKYSDPRYWGAFILIDGMDFSEEQIKQKAALIDTIHAKRVDQYNHAIELKMYFSKNDYQVQEELEKMIMDVWTERRDKSKRQ